MTRRWMIASTTAALLLASAGSARASGIQTELLASMGGIEEKLVALAEAMPEEKYSWRPGDGVRSVSEVFMHIASANFFLPGMIGAPAPNDVNPRDLEKTVTKKNEVVATLKKSLAHARKTIEGVPAGDLEKGVNVFGQERSYQGVLVILIEHMSEHLGQSIAYARMNGVVPPWSQ